MQFTFTPKQTEILEKLGTGAEYRAIAAELGVTVDTIKNHVSAMLQKSGSDNSRHLVAKAFREGLLR